MKMKLDNCNSLLVNKECVSVGKMLDHAVHSLHLNADSFFALFITSGLAKVFEQNDIRYIAGMSGIELSYEVLERCGVAYSRITPRHTAGLSKEYYAGYALALMQAETGLSYKVLTDAMPVSEMISIYENYHSNAVNELPWQMAGEERADSIDKIKADFPSFLFDEMKAILSRQYSDVASDSSGKKAKKETHLKEMRLRNGLSQSRLAAASGVPLRTIQQYEQRQKDISKASFDHIIRLSNALHCDPAELLEQSIEELIQ